MTDSMKTGWVLLPSFKPAERTFQNRPSYRGYLYTVQGKAYAQSEVFLTREEAIASGRIKVATQMADVKKREAKVLKRIAALDKAEAK